MNRDEILEKSRRENRRQDEREKSALSRADVIAGFVGIITAAIIVVLDLVLADSFNHGVVAVVLSICGTSMLVKYIKLKKKYELILGIFELVIGIMSFANHIAGLVR